MGGMGGEAPGFQLEPALFCEVDADGLQVQFLGDGQKGPRREGEGESEGDVTGFEIVFAATGLQVKVIRAEHQALKVDTFEETIAVDVEGDSRRRQLDPDVFDVHLGDVRLFCLDEIQHDVTWTAYRHAPSPFGRGEYVGLKGHPQIQPERQVYLLSHACTPFLHVDRSAEWPISWLAPPFRRVSMSQDRGHRTRLLAGTSKKEMQSGQAWGPWCSRESMTGRTREDRQEQSVVSRYAMRARTSRCP
jgi:hypothetical protein